MKYKKTVIYFFVFASLPGVVFLSIMYIIDPLQLFHKHWFYKNYLVSDMRKQSPGIIKNYEFDSIILGSSMLENTSSQEATEILSGKFVNLSLRGSDFRERSLVLNLSFKYKNIKRVIYSLDNNGLIESSKHDMSYYDYLYDDNLLNDFYIYTDAKHLRKYLKCMYSENSCSSKNIQFDKPNAWDNDPVLIKRFGGINQWIKYRKDPFMEKTLKEIIQITQKIIAGEKNIYNIEQRSKESREYMMKHLISFVQRYPDTEFILILPPYFIGKYSLMAQYNKSDFGIYLNNIEFLVRLSEEYSNLKIYGWGNEVFTNNIENYLDLTHYHTKYNTWMLEQINRDNGILNNDNVEQYISILNERALGFDIISLGNYIRKKHSE